MLRPTAAVALSALLVTGCGGGAPPEVTFAAAGTEASARPAQYCDVALTECSDDAAAPVELGVPPGTPVTVEVPDEVAETPWTVVFSYRDGTGAQVDERSAVFPPGRESFTLTLPGAADQLLTAEVQQIGAPQADPATGEILYPARASWVLLVTR